ncbi:AraC family transcriptional regulator [Planctomicrobium sp. SH661]|uniref:helix-turn-helix transcriptional regulator n=1 Tax=Planctomicrobium sp. SH661 TaxID=3448124 RepID=UPI003F5B1451
MSKITKDYFRYLHVSPHDQLWGLNVTGVGAMAIGPHDSYPPAQHPDVYQFSWPQKRVLSEYQLLYLPVGEGQFESEAGGSHRITAGTVLLTFPGDWHRYRPCPQVGWQEYWFGFVGEIADRWVEQGIITPEKPILRVFQSSDLQRTCEAVLTAVRDELPGMQQVLSGGVMSILGMALATERIGVRGDRHALAIRQAKQILSNSFEAPVSIEKLAARCHLSEAQFRRVFRQHTGVSPSQFSIQMRVIQAKELLSGTDMSIKQIAAKLQFGDQFHFSKTFRGLTGISPSQWRGSAQTKN